MVWKWKDREIEEVRRFKIFGIRNNGEWGTGSAGGREGEKRSSSNERAVGYRKEEIR